MDWSLVGRYEWVIMFAAILGLALCELRNIRRELKRQREREAAERQE